jgi:hypothetical protein
MRYCANNIKQKWTKYEFVQSSVQFGSKLHCRKKSLSGMKLELQNNRPLKNGFAASQKSFPLRRRPEVIMVHDKPLTSSLERRKTFDSPLANHFSAAMQHVNNPSFTKRG